MEVDHKLNEGIFFGSLDTKRYRSHSVMLLMRTMLCSSGSYPVMSLIISHLFVFLDLEEPTYNSVTE